MRDGSSKSKLDRIEENIPVGGRMIVKHFSKDISDSTIKALG